MLTILRRCRLSRLILASVLPVPWFMTHYAPACGTVMELFGSILWTSSALRVALCCIELPAYD